MGGIFYFGIDVDNELTKIWKSCRLRYTRPANEQYFPARMGKKEPLRDRGKARAH